MDREVILPSFGVFLQVLHVIHQDVVMLDGGGEQQFLVVLEFVEVVSEVVEVLFEGLDFLSPEEIEDPAENGGADSNGDRDWVYETFVSSQVVG